MHKRYVQRGSLSGDKGRDQVVTLHYMQSKASVKSRPRVLWCYKKELGFTSHRIKRQKKLKVGIAPPHTPPHPPDTPTNNTPPPPPPPPSSCFLLSSM
jgi:tRNA(Met) C34 N-acetyltransferase TmcA